MIEGAYGSLKASNPGRVMSRTSETLHPSLSLALGLMLTAAACGSPAAPDSDTDPITELPRALTTRERTVIDDGNAFGLALLHNVVTRDGRPNVILSPLSASLALGMTLNGAAGGTFEAMRSTLGFDGMSQHEINEAYRGLIDMLTTLDPDVRFDIADAVWANEGFTFRDAFLQAVRDAFGAKIEVGDFANPATAAAINQWVSESTNGLIGRIVDQLDPSMAMMLLNAIYFDGAWTTRFDPADTRPADFTREDGSTVRVDMMNVSDTKLPMGGGDGYQAVELPYGGGAFSMVILLPWPGESARHLLNGLDAAAWQEVVDHLSPTEVDRLSMPKFTLAYDTYLNDPLKAMGMEVAFGPGADFTAMSPEGDRMCIDFVRQKTYVDVDERGTRAAAVTGVGVRGTSFMGVSVDRPFVFAIRERLSGTLLFVGLVGDPTYADSGPDDLASTCG